MSTIVKAVCQHCQRVTTVPAEAIAAATPPDQMVVLQRAAEALKPLADAVFNDNGDMTVSVPLLSAEECIQAYFAVKRIRAALSAPEAEG